jgi:hypothetical protein
MHLHPCIAVFQSQTAQGLVHQCFRDVFLYLVHDLWESWEGPLHVPTHGCHPYPKRPDDQKLEKFA